MNFGGGGYDASASQFAGAGFMPTQAGGDAGGGMQQKKHTGDSTLRACTIRQLVKDVKDTDDDVIRVDDKDLTNFTLVGKIKSVNENATRMTIHLEDSTGNIEIMYWIPQEDSNFLAQKRNEWRAGTYVRVYGHMRTFNNAKSMVAFNIRPITDFNEITFHFMQVIFQHCHITKGAPPAGGAMAKPGMAFGNNQGMGAGFGGNTFNGGAAAGGFQGGAQPGAFAGMGGSNMTPCQTDVWNLLKSDHIGDKGFTVDEIVQHLAQRYPRQAVQEAVDWLANEAHVYTTVDDHHFKGAA